MNGMLANNDCEGWCVFLIDAAPITVSTTPAPKLALAEKHIRFNF
jgi:hypothetical protein